MCGKPSGDTTESCAVIVFACIGNDRAVPDWRNSCLCSWADYNMHNRKIYDGLLEHLVGKVQGDVTVKLWESHSAWASYRGSLSMGKR